MYVPTHDKIHYNEVILYLEEKWQRKLTDHEKNVGIEFYNFGRYIQQENDYIVEVVKCSGNTF